MQVGDLEPLLWGWGLMGLQLHITNLSLLPTALHRLWVPLRGSSPTGGHRQWLCVPAGALQPPPQLPQPRVLPWEAHLQRGKCSVGGKSTQLRSLERFSPNPNM